MVEEVYRTRSYPLIGWTLLLFIGLMFLGVVSMTEEPALGRWIGALILGGMGLLTWRTFVRPYVQADATGVVVVNPFTTHRITWNQVQRIYADHLLRIETQEGKTITAWAVQAANITRMMGRRSRADEIAEELSELASVHQPSTAQPEPHLSSSVRRRAWLFAGFVLVIAALSLAVQFSSTT